MSNRRTELQAKSRDGDQLQLTSQDTDSPVLPVAQLKALSEFRPDLVDWVVSRTEVEATARHARTRRVDTFIFVERIGGLFGGVLIAALGIGVAGYLALNGAEPAAMVIGGGTLVSIVTVIIRGKRNASPPVESPPDKKR
jgi:hypothetical protein